ncbi:MAG: acyl-CoA dehydrogenase C-terminal domain-containing protein [Gemmatimonadetes bacterium]|nr:acyl-CoA dehydrogenase C-terminal domain-containing protein [Gemmatimonadota bacterium]
MPTYKAPLDDMRFVLHDVLDVAQLSALPGYEEATPDLIDAILEEAGRFCAEVLQPLNQPGDAAGCTYEQGEVKAPPGFKEAYQQYCAGGWPALTADPKYGGQGMPHLMRSVVEEMMCASNLSFAMYPGLAHGAYHAMHTHGTEELKDKLLPKLVSGQWGGTMCLTEPHAGTDLGIITTKAVPAGDGAYRLTGTKIFISAGEHDLTENIIHLVLAKLPDAPGGTRGISMFMVPKFLPTDEGRPGTRNGVTCGSIEHKMGIKGNATCVLNFDNATGWMVGDANKGMRAMFTMMNGARLGVGLQGLGLGEVAYQNAVAYARERLQGRSLTGAKNPGGPADPIIEHPAVRQGLLRVKALNEGNRAFAYWIGMHIDLEHRHPDPARRAESADLVALMTPVIKAFLTDTGFESTNIALQTFGGHGYVREYGMEQFVRDARIAPIYEGTNAVQAMDLVGRKLPEGMGRLLRRFFHPVSAEVEASRADPALAEFVEPLAKAFERLQQATQGVAMRSMANPDEAGAAAEDYLHLLGYVTLGYMWLRMVKAARARLAAGADDRAAFYEAKVATGRFYFAKVLPQVHALAARIAAGATTVMSVPVDAF